MRKLTTKQAETIINDLCKLGRSIGGIKNPAWIVDHDDIEMYIITNTAEDEEQTDLYNMVIEHISGVIPECDCDHCLEGKTQIALRKIDEFWLEKHSDKSLNDVFIEFVLWLREDK